jgi:hypothetical protein
MPAASTVKITVRLAKWTIVILSRERAGPAAALFLAALRTKSRSSAVIKSSHEVVESIGFCQE